MLLDKQVEETRVAIMKKREKTSNELETERLFKTMIVGAALAILVNLMVALLWS